MRRLIDRWGLREPILDLADRGRAAVRHLRRDDRPGASEIAGGEEPVLPLLDVTVERNAFGRQLDSFETELMVPLLGDQPVHAVFIRAPVIERVGPGVDVMATLDDGRIVAVRERNVIATAFHPELAGETRFHRLVATMAAEHADPGEGRRPAAPPHPPRAAGAVAMARSAGKVRAARLTDLAALGELSRLAQADGDGTRSLGLPGVGAADRRCSACSGCRSGAFSPNDVMYVFDRDGARRRPAARRAREPARRVDGRGARRGRRPRRRRRALPARPAPAARRRASGAPSGSTSPARDADDNVELFMQAGFIRFGDEHVLFREPDDAAAGADGRRRGAAARHPARHAARRACRCRRLYASVTPQPGPAAGGRPHPRLGAPGPRLAGPAQLARADPPVRRRRRLRPGVARAAARTARSSTRSSRSASRRRTSRTTSRCSRGPEADVVPLSATRWA